MSKYQITITLDNGDSKDLTDAERAILEDGIESDALNRWPNKVAVSPLVKID